MNRRDFVLTAGGLVVPAWCGAGLISMSGGRGVPVPEPSSGGGGDAPSWFTSANDLEWGTIPFGNNFFDADIRDPLALTTNFGGDGYPGTFLTPWVGMFTDETRRLIGMLMTGGHDSYFGNEVYTGDLSLETPLWKRWNDATPKGDVTGNPAAWPDGRPTTTHTAQNTLAAEGRWFSIGMWAPSGGGASGYPERNWEFDPTGTNPDRIDSTPGVPDYIDLGSHWSVFGAADHLAACFDPIDREIVKIPGNFTTPSPVFYDLDNMAAAPVIQNTHGFQDSSCVGAAVDTTNHVLLLRGGSGLFAALSLEDGTTKLAAPATISVTGTPPNASDGYNWHAPSGGFLGWSRTTGQIIKITPTVSGGNYTGLTCTAYTPAGTAPIFGAGISGGLYNRVSLINDMGDGRSAFLVGHPDTAQPGANYFVKIPSGGLH